MNGFLQLLLWSWGVALEVLEAAFNRWLSDSLSASGLPGELAASMLSGIAMLVLFCLIVFGSWCALRTRSST